MTRVNLPPGCYGFSGDGGQTKILAERGPGSFVHVDDDRQLRKIRRNDYAEAGLVDAGPEKFSMPDGPQGRWCLSCLKLWHAWRTTCFCGEPTVPESEVELPRIAADDYIP